MEKLRTFDEKLELQMTDFIELEKQKQVIDRIAQNAGKSLQILSAKTGKEQQKAQLIEILKQITDESQLKLKANLTVLLQIQTHIDKNFGVLIAKSKKTALLQSTEGINEE